MPMTTRARLLAGCSALALCAVAGCWLLRDQATGDFAVPKFARRLTASMDTDTTQPPWYSNLIAVGWQLLFGVAYYFIILTNYPEFIDKPPTDAAKETQAKNEFSAMISCENSCPIIFYSWCCFAARGAHTYDKVGLIPYWVGLVLGSVFPCLMLFYMNACTDLNTRLGGEQRSCMMACLCSFFCACCVIAQDATALDECTLVEVGFCGVNQSTDSEASE